MEKGFKKAGEACFWAALFIELVIVVIEKSAYTNPYESLVFRLTFLLFCIKILSTKYTRGEWLVIILCGGLAVLSYWINERDETVRAAVLVAACKDVDLKKELKRILLVTVLGSVVLFVLSATGIFGSFSITANFGRGSTPEGSIETRYCFGMGHPNAFQGMLFMMTTLVLYLYAQRMKLISFLALLALNLVSYLFTDSNTAILVTIFAILGIIVLKYIEPLRQTKIVYAAGAAVFLAAALFSAYGAVTGVQNAFMFRLDKVLNGRFQYAYLVEDARLVNWKLFAAPENQAYFDQGFIRLFYWYGIVIGLGYIAANLYLIWQSWRKKDYCLLVIVAAYAVFSLMEAHLISVYLLRNYLLIWLGYYWYQPFQERVQAKA